MVGPDLDDSGSGLGVHAQVASSDTTAANGSWRAWFALLAGATAIGAFIASLALQYQVELQQAAIVPATPWLRSFPDWLPWFCIGFGLLRLVAPHAAAQTALRGLGIGAVFALAASLAWFGPVLSWLPSAVAALLGAVLGLHWDSVRRLARSGVILAGLLAAATAFAVLFVPQLQLVTRLPDATVWCPADVLGVALTAVLLGLAIEAERMAPVTFVGLRLRWLLIGWTLVVLLVAWIASVAGAADWVLLSSVVAVVMTAAAAGRLGLALGACLAVASLLVAGLTGAGAGSWFAEDRATLAKADHQREDYVVLGRCGHATALYGRSNQELQLRLGGEIVAAAGPDRGEEALVQAIVHAVARDGDRVLLLGGGTGRIAASLRGAARCDVEVATAWTELAALQSTVLVDGAVPAPATDSAADSAAESATAIAPWPKALAELPRGSRQVLVLGELPTAATAHRATRSFQRQLRRVVGNGVICQPIALDRVSVPLLETWFAVVGESHAWNGLYAVGNAAVLVSAMAKPCWRSDFVNWARGERWALHAAHLGGPADLELALLGPVKQASQLQPLARAGRGSAKDVARCLLRWLALPDTVTSSSPTSCLQRWQSQHDDMQRARGRLLTLPNDAAGRAEAQAIAAQFLPIGAPRPWLQAALGLAGSDGVALQDASVASRSAYAMDPTFFWSPAAVYATLPLPNQKRGDLEDLFRLDDGERLARMCSGSGPQAVALRARFASRCASSLVLELQRAPLAGDAASALRELADPFVLREAAAVLVPAGRWHELLAFWRADLPLPNALQGIACGDNLADQLLLAGALRGRRDVSCHPVIATFLAADSLELRQLAQEALRLSVGDQVPFDAHWPRSRRLDAASRLMDLHNRKP